MQIIKLPVEEWPRDLDHIVAVIKEPPEEIANVLGMQFDEAYDDLDWYKVLIFKIEDKGPFALRRYRNNPLPGTDIITTRCDAETVKQIKNILKILNISWNSVTSLHPNLKTTTTKIH